MFPASLPDDEDDDSIDPIKDGVSPAEEKPTTYRHDEQLYADPSEETLGEGEVDINDIVELVEHDDEKTLIDHSLISADYGYTIEELKNQNEAAWKKACERFLQIAVYKYHDIVSFYLSGVGAEDAKSAVADIVSDLQKTITKYPSIPALHAAFRKALGRDIHSLQRKFLTKKRGAGLVDNSAEVHGLSMTDAPISQDTYKDEDEAPPSIDTKINQEYVGWGSHADQDSAAVASKVDQRRVMQEAMDELSEKERQLLHLRFVEKLKQKEIAERMGKGVSQIGSELKRTEAKLKKLVADKTLNEKKNLL